MPSVTVRRVFEAPATRVWELIADIENAHQWNKAWQKIEVLSSLSSGSGTRFRAHNSDGERFDFQVVDWSPLRGFSLIPVSTEGQDEAIVVRSQTFGLVALSEREAELSLTASIVTKGLRGWIVGRTLWAGFQREGLMRALEAIADLLSSRER